jgi:hypothetical protein
LQRSAEDGIFIMIGPAKNLSRYKWYQVQYDD